MWQENNSYHYKIYYLTNYFVFDNSTDNYMDNSTNNSMDDSIVNFVDNFNIISMDHSMIPSKGNSMIPSGDNSVIPPRDKSKITSVDNYMINPRDNSKIPSMDNYTITNSTIPSGYIYKIPSGNNYNVLPVEPGSSSDIIRSATSTIPSMLPTNLPKLRDSEICQQIWSHIFNSKQDPKYLKRYNGNKNHWRKVKNNWEAAISASKWDFILKSSRVSQDDLDPYACNTANLEDGYIFKILDLNTPTINSHQ